MLNEASQTAVGPHPLGRRRAHHQINVRLKHIEFVRLEPERALVVLVAEDGQVENRILNVPAGLPSSALTEAANFLNAHVRGKTLAEPGREIEKALEAGQAELDQLTQKIVEAGLASWSGGESEDRQLIVRGHANLLDDLKALEDLERVRSLFDDLETKRGVIDLLGRAEQRRGRAHLHRLGEQAVLAVGLLDHRGALSRRPGPHRRRHRGDRPDPAQLCPRHPDGGLHRQGGEQACWRVKA